MLKPGFAIAGIVLLIAPLSAIATSIGTIRPANYDLPKQANLFLVQSKGKCGYIDKTGKVVIPFAFDRGGIFSEGLAAVQVGSLWGYIDRGGRFVISPRFELAEQFSDGLAAVQLNGKLGSVSPAGEVITVPPGGISPEPFREGMAPYGEHESRGYIDTSGQI